MQENFARSTIERAKEGLSNINWKDVLIGAGATLVGILGVNAIGDFGWFDPKADELLIDSDGDTIPDFAETVLGTNPKSRDTDNDGTPDYTEVQFDANGLEGIGQIYRWVHKDEDGNQMPDALQPSRSTSSAIEIK